MTLAALAADRTRDGVVAGPPCRSRARVAHDDAGPAGERDADGVAGHRVLLRQHDHRRQARHRVSRHQLPRRHRPAAVDAGAARGRSHPIHPARESGRADARPANRAAALRPARRSAVGRERSGAKGRRRARARAARGVPRHLAARVHRGTHARRHPHPPLLGRDAARLSVRFLRRVAFPARLEDGARRERAFGGLQRPADISRRRLGVPRHVRIARARGGQRGLRIRRRRHAVRARVEAAGYLLGDAGGAREEARRRQRARRNTDDGDQPATRYVWKAALIADMAKTYRPRR